MAPTTTAELIAAVGDRLTPTERRIAEAVLAEPTLLAFGTVSDLAARVGTSRPSIVRFATKLGFEGYSDLQDHVRLGLSQRLSRPTERVRHDDMPGVSVQPAWERALASVFEAWEANGSNPTERRTGRMSFFISVSLWIERLSDSGRCPDPRITPAVSPRVAGSRWGLVSSKAPGQQRN